MFDILGGGIIGSVFGGLFRLAPEVLKFFDQAKARDHEFRMMGLQIEVEKTRGQVRIEQAYVEHGTAQLDAIREAFKEQSATAQAAGPFVSAASALVRPGVTYCLFALYVGVKLTAITYAISGGAPWNEVLVTHWTPDDFGMLNLIITFWFVGRAIERYGSGMGGK